MRMHYKFPWRTVAFRYALPVRPIDWGLRDYGVDDQLGLEQTPDEYVANMVAVFREVWRVLRDDGVVFLNLGDSYNGSGGAGGDYNKGGLREGQPKYGRKDAATLKSKDLVGIPWRVALALQADGWYLRNDIIWHKTNPMPESVTDRCTKSHEYIFLLAKSEQYYYDHEAIKELAHQAGKKQSPGTRTFGDNPDRNDNDFADRNKGKVFNKRNKRTVWTISTKPYHGAHYAVFPPEIPELAIKAGTSEKGQCPECGAPWERVIERKTSNPQREGGEHNWIKNEHAMSGQDERAGGFYDHKAKTVNWKPTCDCGTCHDFDMEDELHRCRNCGILKEGVEKCHGDEPQLCSAPQIILDPFVGSGTTCVVARELGRHGVGIDLSFDYLKDNARKRLQLDKLDSWTNGSGKRVEGEVDELPMFGGGQPEKHHKNMERDNPHTMHKKRLE